MPKVFVMWCRTPSITAIARTKNFENNGWKGWMDVSFGARRQKQQELKEEQEREEMYEL
jgi:hypothetical protein